MARRGRGTPASRHWLVCTVSLTRLRVYGQAALPAAVNQTVLLPLPLGTSAPMKGPGKVPTRCHGPRG